MLGNSQYHRSFIILNARDSGYSLSERKEPAGYCKLEIRKNQGRLQLYVQDLKPADTQQGIYDVVLVSNRDEIHPVKITSIQVPDSGRGEYEITFDPDNVQDTGAPIDQFHGLAVVYRQLKGEMSLQYALVGYSDKRVSLDWSNTVTEKLEKMYNRKKPTGLPKNRLEDKKPSIGIMAVGEQALAAEAEEAVEVLEAYTDVPAEAEDSITIDAPIENETIPEQEVYMDDGAAAPEDDDEFYRKLEGAYSTDDNGDPVLDQNVVEDEINPEVLAFEPPDISYIYQESSVPESSTYSMKHGDSTYWDKVKDYFHRLFDNHKKVTPFDDYAGEVDWIRVENHSEPMYSYYQMYRSNYPDHYLVGLVRNQGKVQYVVYGIPGIYSITPPMSMHGFSRWLPVKNGYGAGYWLLYIDAISGNIAYPY